MSVCTTPGKGEQAIEACTALLEREDLDPRARGILFYHIGNAEMQLGHFEPALASLENAASLAPNDPIAPVARSSAFLGLGQHGRSIEEAHAALERWPTMPRPLQSEALRNVALAYQALGKPQQELNALDDYIAAFPSDAASLRHRALLLAEHGGQIQRADKIYAQLTDLNRAIALDPTHWQAYEARAKVLDRMGITAVAKGETARALKTLLDHGDDAGPVEGARREAVMMRYHAALAAHTASVKALNSLTAEFALNADALALRARAHFMQGRLDAAIADLEALEKLRPDDDKLGKEVTRLYRVRAALDDTILTTG